MTFVLPDGGDGVYHVDANLSIDYLNSISIFINVSWFINEAPEKFAKC